jgi:4-amino-4-deoxy-L-arabinose transferase-like glycosyltransferase
VPKFWASLLLAAMCLVIYVPGQRTLPITDRDEARFMQATRQMLESGDWIVVRFQDQLRAKKPAGIYWLQSASVGMLSHAASLEAWPYRLPSLLSAIGLVLITFGIAEALFDRRLAFIAAVVLGTSLLVGVEAHLATTDAALAALTCAAQGCLALIYVRHRSDVRSPSNTWLLFWVALGAAIMIKGPVAPMICGLTIATLSIADRDIRWLLRLRPVLGVLIVIAMVAPWFVAVTRSTNGIFLSRAIHEDLLPKLMSGHEGHGAPPGYYALMLTLSMWPASGLLWPALWHARTARAEPAVRFVLAWAIPSWIAFELIPTKLPHYTLPLHPSFAILIALGIARFLLPTKAHGIFAYAWFVFWSLCSLAIAVGFIWIPIHFGPDTSVIASLGALVILVSIGCLWWLVSRGRSERALLGGAIAGASAQIILIAFLAPTLSDLWMSQRLAQVIQQLDPQGIVAAAGYYEPSFVFLLNGRTYESGGAGAATSLEHGENTVAAIEDRELSTFMASLPPGAVIEKAVVSGFNYSQGKRVRVHVFQRRP